MPDFNGTRKVMLRPGANAVPISWQFTAATANNTNDGSIPYGTTISNATVAVYGEDGTNRTSVVVNNNSTQIVGAVVSATLKHPNTGSNNTTAVTLREQKTYTAVVTLTLNNGAVIPYECRRILVDAVEG